MLRNRVKQLLRHAIRITVKEPDPLFVWRLNPRKPGQQGRQTILDPKIFAVTSGVLADQVDFAHALGKHTRCFQHHRFEPPAAKLSAILRDDTETAWMIAAFGDLYIGR